MTQENRKALWDELTNAGVKPTRHYREYSEAELQQGVDELRARQAAAAPAFEFPDEVTPPASVTVPAESPRDEVAGLRLNTQPEDEPIRVDPDGRMWFQDEVRKPPYAKPRGRRRLSYLDSGVKTQTVQSGEFIETFEMPGDTMRQMEARITLPSHQVGIYKDPGLPFKVHVYNEVRGFDYFEVIDFYGGKDLVPQGCKRMYVSGSLCYDIPSVIREIETEYREKVLRKEIQP